MGLTKNYLRYVHDSTFGVVAASQVGASVRFLRTRNTTDRYLAVPANESIFVWDLKTKQIINTFNYDADNAAEVTVFDCYHGGHPRTNLLAVGYANGHIRVFEYETGGLKVTFTGHRTAISSLAFDKDGSRLASGGKDCNIVLWDIVAEKGLFTLKGHKNSITKVSFLYNKENQKDLLVSSSVDAVATIKFWDLQLQHCFCTVPGQSSGVWSFVLLSGGSRLVAGSSGPELKVYSIEFLSQTEKENLKLKKQNDEEDTDEMDEDVVGNSETEYGLRVRHLGNILRNTASISNRVQDIVVDVDEILMICHSIDKNIEVYKVRNQEEALTYARKQAKKEARKQAKRKLNSETEENEPNESQDNSARPTISSLEGMDSQKLVECIFNRKYGSRRLSDKVKAMDISRSTTKSGEHRYKLVAMSASNKIESYLFNADNTENDLEPHVSIENLSHRSDIRSVAISHDNTLIMSSSGESTKIWRLESKSCTTTIETEYATCCAFSNSECMLARYENKFAFVGTKHGNLQIIDSYSANVVETIKVCNEGKSLNAICLLPDKSGIVCGGDDGICRFYSYTWDTVESEGQKDTVLKLEANRTFPFQEGITCINVSANNKYLAVALLDSTVRVHFLDTFKYFLTMYGHKFPVTTMDISDDNNLLATGSADKNIKIWGLDFGDCHKSIFAHDDVITCVKFAPKTHYLFSCGRDRQIKQWDCDHFIKIQILRKHMAEIWCMAISWNGKHLVTASHDKSLRVYRKTDEILIPSEEEETEREMEDERNVFEQQENIVLGGTDIETGFAPKMTIDTVKSTDRLIESIDVFNSEQDKQRGYLLACDAADKKGEPRPPEPERDPLLMTAMTTDHNRFMLETLRKIRSSELEEILLTLPFDYVRKLLLILVIFLERKWDVELVVRCATFLLKINFGQIAASPTLMPIVQKLKATIMERSMHLRDCTGFNLLAMEHMNHNRKFQSTKVSQIERNLSLYL